ncbi:hypothetical protein RND71_014114 [Anisodus tanguticus]|uniref:Uncharacterized protein n=1 Tax=Anisodus tanguticus TaxID=243964 RepID=A0AAE1VMG2_9SOLA|nr:hypothetical protein RND71_014114 [Anisodus tanguticus]
MKNDGLYSLYRTTELLKDCRKKEQLLDHKTRCLFRNGKSRRSINASKGAILKIKIVYLTIAREESLVKIFFTIEREVLKDGAQLAKKNNC